MILATTVQKAAPKPVRTFTPPANRPPLNNFKTPANARARVGSDKNISLEKLNELMTRVVRPRLTASTTYVWDANINGIIVRYTGTSFHQYDFWKDNWHPGPNNGTVLPHAFIYSVQGVPNQEPFAYYCPARNTAVFVNTEYYGQCKSWALGMAAAALERDFHTHSIHGAAAAFEGKGVAIIAPTGTGKTTQVNKILQHPKGYVLGDDWIYIKHPDPKDIVPGHQFQLLITQPEKQLYVRTENAKEEPWLRPVFDRCKTENVCTLREECEHQPGETCALDEGDDRCYWGFGNARAMLPREWMKGPEKVIDSVPLKLLVLLRRDRTSPAEVWLEPDEAIRTLQKGEYMIRPGAGPKEKWGTMAEEAWYNPYLLVPDHAKQEEFFRREMDVAKCIILNTGVESIQKTFDRIANAVRQVE